MATPVISVRGVSKRYILGAMAGHDTLRDQLAHGARALGRMFSPGSHSRANGGEPEGFWALNDVSFDLDEGEVLGVVGSNGAGKSTLLKILSQITEPTEGEIRVRGRVASLLEVGTGFHPELSGRENVFLNGAVLGMSRREIRAKFDEIVAFAEVEKFLDTPVKRYSSGMYVRLAFAVAAHLEPEILIVDEVLAVGDVQFQKKCLGKMKDVSQTGRTVLFVSHNMSAVESLCTRAILLEKGRLSMSDTAVNVVRHYVQETHAQPRGGSLADRTDRKGQGAARMLSFRILDEETGEEAALQSGGNYIFAVDYENRTSTPLENVIAGIEIFDERQNRVLLLRTNFTDENLTLRPGRGAIRCKVRDLPLAHGLYSVTLFLVNRVETEIIDAVLEAAAITVGSGDFFGTGHPGMPRDCKVLCRASWASV
jgi:lipopolysaccharide transport system ATP-binding protein